MIEAVHLLDDFAMGGVVKALEVFDEPEIAALVRSETMPLRRSERIAPRLNSDVIFLHFPAAWRRLPWLLSLRLRNPGARIVQVEHSYTRAFEERQVANRTRFRANLKMAMTLVDDIVCVSEGQRRWLVEAAKLEPGKVRTIHPWSGREDLAAIPPPDFTISRPLRLAAFGRFSEEKNFAPLIEAAALLGEQVCQLALGGAGPLENELRDAASMAPNVTLYGRIDDVAGFLAACDAVIVPSLQEAFGLVAVEARLAARPILVSDVDGLPEQAEGNGQVAPCTTSADIAQAIAHFAKMPLATMAEKARGSALGHRQAVIEGWKALVLGSARQQRPDAA